jgi:hypothetical protein
VVVSDCGYRRRRPAIASTNRTSVPADNRRPPRHGPRSQQHLALRIASSRRRERNSPASRDDFTLVTHSGHIVSSSPTIAGYRNSSAPTPQVGSYRVGPTQTDVTRDRFVSLCNCGELAGSHHPEDLAVASATAAPSRDMSTDGCPFASIHSRVPPLQKCEAMAAMNLATRSRPETGSRAVRTIPPPSE